MREKCRKYRSMTEEKKNSLQMIIPVAEDITDKNDLISMLKGQTQIQAYRFEFCLKRYAASCFTVAALSLMCWERCEKNISVEFLYLPASYFFFHQKTYLRTVLEHHCIFNQTRVFHLTPGGWTEPSGSEINTTFQLTHDSTTDALVFSWTSKYYK